jgi:hypothetical protein
MVIAEVGGRRSEVGGRRPEVGGWRSEVGGQWQVPASKTAGENIAVGNGSVDS